jgi:hypothetical protein
MKKSILTPEHIYWDVFCREFLEMLLSDNGSNPYCECQDDLLRHSKEVLKSIGDIDIEGTLEFFKNYGVYCDCDVKTEIIFTYFDFGSLDN